MKNVTKRIRFVNQVALNIRIASAYHVTLLREYVMTVRSDFLIIYQSKIKIMLYAEHYLEIECNSDEDCKGENNKCDLDSNKCRITCNKEEDCKGNRMSCNTERRFCVRGKRKLLTLKCS